MTTDEPPPQNILSLLQDKNVAAQIEAIQILYRKYDPDSQAKWISYWQHQTEVIFLYIIENSIEDEDFIDLFWPVIEGILRQFGTSLCAVLARFAIYLNFRGLEGNSEKFSSLFLKSIRQKIRPTDERIADELEFYLGDPNDDWARIIDIDEPELSEDSAEDIGCFSSRRFLRLVKVVYSVARIFSGSSDVITLLRGVIPYVFSLRWNLVGWSGTWNSENGIHFDRKDLPSDSLHIDHEFRGHVLDLENQAAILSLEILFKLCTPEDSSKSKSWINASRNITSDGIFYCPQLIQLGSLIVLSSAETGQMKYGATAATYLVEYQKKMIAGTPAGYLLSTHCIEPLIAACGDNSVLVSILQTTSKCPVAVSPLDIIDIKPTRIAKLRAKYVSITDAKFFEKARQLNQRFLATREDMKLTRQTRDERRTTNKLIRRQAEVYTDIQHSEDHSRRKLQSKQQERVQRNLAKDSSELQKLKTGLTKDIKRKLQNQKDARKKPEGARSLSTRNRLLDKELRLQHYN